MAQGTTCLVCNLPDTLREEVRRRLQGDPGDPSASPPRPPVEPTSAPKISTWLEEHNVHIRGATINEHRRRHLDPKHTSEGADTKAQEKKGGGKKTPPLSPEPPPAPSAPPSAQGTPAPPQRPEIHFIDRILEDSAHTYMLATQSLRRRLDAERNGALFSVPGEAGAGEGRGRGAGLLVGPTKGDADFLPAMLSGMAAMLKTRHVLVTGASGAGAKGGVDGETLEGLKNLFAGATPPRPPAIEGDAPDPILDSEVPGYEPAVPADVPPAEATVSASPQPAPPTPQPVPVSAPSPAKAAAPIPPPPPSGPRSNVVPIAPLERAFNS